MSAVKSPSNKLHIDCSSHTLPSALRILMPCPVYLEVRLVTSDS